MPTRTQHRAAASACLLLAVFAAASACSRSRSVRIVLVTIDTLRYDSFAGAGGGETMPRLRERAARGASFERSYASAPSTQPTHASLMTGLHPWQHGVTRNRLRLPEELETVPELLREAGFATAAVVASFPLDHRFGFDQGFDRYHDELSRGSVGSRWRLATRQARRGDVNAVGPGEASAYFSLASDVLASALAQLDQADADRQFFWFHFFDPHSPYGDTVEGPTIKPREILRQVAKGRDPWPAVRRARRLYDADVRSLDTALDELLGRLEEDAGRFETHVVVTADHGESFGEDGSTAHGRRLTPGQIHVPLILLSPRVEPGPRDDVTGSVDVAATLLALAGLEAPGGRNLLEPPQRRPTAFGMRRAFDKPFEDQRLDGSVVMLERPLFYMVDADGGLYRGHADEVVHVGARGSESPQAATADLQALFAAFEQEWAGRSIDSLDDPETLKALKALGYTR